MFTGIIENLGEVTEIAIKGTNKTFKISSYLSPDLKVDQSLCHNGVCLTVEQVTDDSYQVTAIYETLIKTCLNDWKIGSKINLERCMPAQGRFDGHIVQGHVDQIAICTAIEDHNGSWKVSFTYNPDLGNITVEKGSICVNGISLTVVDSKPDGFSVALIPYTWEHTNMHQLQKGDVVNLEFDILGKYMQKIMSLHNKSR